MKSGQKLKIMVDYQGGNGSKNYLTKKASHPRGNHENPTEPMVIFYVPRSLLDGTRVVKISRLLMRFGRFLRVDIIVFGQRTLPSSSPANRLRSVETVFGGERKDRDNY